MGFTAGSYQLTVNTLTGDGNGGYWWLTKDSSDVVYNIGWTTANVETAAAIYGRNTFRLLMQAMIQNNLLLPVNDVQINVTNKAENNMITAEFEAPALSDSDLQVIANNYDIEELLKKFGVFILVRRYYLLGLLTLNKLSNVLIYLGQQEKVTKKKVENVTLALLNNGDITQTQYNNFWTLWANQVGT